MARMIERMAQAICCPSGGCANSQKRYDPIRGHVSICYAKTFERDASAALKAMREPTFDPDAVSYHDGMSRTDWWRAMIDAALAELVT